MRTQITGLILCAYLLPSSGYGVCGGLLSRWSNGPGVSLSRTFVVFSTSANEPVWRLGILERILTSQRTMPGGPMTSYERNIQEVEIVRSQSCQSLTVDYDGLHCVAADGATKHVAGIRRVLGGERAMRGSGHLANGEYVSVYIVLDFLSPRVFSFSFEDGKQTVSISPD